MQRMQYLKRLESKRVSRQKLHSDFMGADFRVFVISPSLTPTSPYRKQPNRERTRFPWYHFPRSLDIIRSSINDYLLNTYSVRWTPRMPQ